MTTKDRDLAHQPWLEHSLGLAMEPGQGALKHARLVNLEVRAVFAAGYALGRLLAWRTHLEAHAPDFLKDAMHNGMTLGRTSYVPLKSV